jgi:hypothetical protein
MTGAPVCRVNVQLSMVAVACSRTSKAPPPIGVEKTVREGHLAGIGIEA